MSDCWTCKHSMGNPLAGRPKGTRLSDREAFDWYAAKSEGCWLWMGYVGTSGYGQIRLGGKLTGAHRLSWRVNYGEIPAGLHVLHKCDNRRCVNPAHLFLGTNKDNIADRVAKGRPSGLAVPGARKRTGAANNKTKISADGWREMETLRQQGATYRQLAKRFGIGEMYVGRVLRLRLATQDSK